MGGLPSPLRFRVADMDDTRERDILPLTKADHARAGTRGDRRRQVAVLAGEILVNEERLNQVNLPCNGPPLNPPFAGHAQLPPWRGGTKAGE